ncbi:MAG: hypothetical protein I3274_07385 [Candidatus Moeniiplasma glomeromycotorum]|nr:hypothetical protein [Candidatus Moeniiplasma glomeromycotorum]
MTLEQNKNQILNNLDKYTIDGMGNFVNLEKNYDEKDYIIWKTEVKDYEEIRRKVGQPIIKDKEKWGLTNNEEVMEDIAEVILLEKNQWEIIYETGWFGLVNIRPISFKHLPTGKKMDGSSFNFKQFYFLSGELGCRKDIWKDYEKRRSRGLREWRRDRKNRRKQQIINATNPIPQQTEPSQNHNSTPNSFRNNSENKPKNQGKPKSKFEFPPTQENPIDKENKNFPPIPNQNQNPKKETNNPTNQKQNNPAPKLDKNNSSPEKGKGSLDNSSIPSTNNQNQSNHDKDNNPKKENNSNPTSSENQQDQEFLKVINEAELLIKKKKFNSKILTKLIAEKKQNSSLYQSLNKDGKIDKLIRELENIQQAQNKSRSGGNKSVKNNRNDNKFPKEMIFIGIFSILLIIIGLGILVIGRKKKVKNKY